MRIRKETLFGITFTFMLILLLTSCGNDDSNNPTTPDYRSEIEELTMFEEALVGVWSRYHSYDDSHQYYSFNSNRTGSEWEIQSNGSVTDEETLTYWALEGSGSYYRIRKAGVHISTNPEGYLSSDEFHYDLNEIWRGGYDTLRMRPD